jgi:thioredoxin-related protein
MEWLTMKKVVAWLSVILACVAAPAWAEVDGVVPVSNLQQDAESARAINGVILLVMVAENCRYCEHVQNDYLIPMSHNPSYQERLIIRRVLVSSLDNVRGIDGKPTTPTELASLYGTKFTPSVVLLDSAGHRLTKPLIGFSSPDYYGMYLDDAINEAVAKVRSPNQAN